MLASITPLGERGRQQRWAVTVTAFVVGATVAGAALGAVLGAAGIAFDGRQLVLVAATLVAIGLDAAGAVPGPRRQVNERWLDRYRGWVYGLGFGAQLGVGVATVVTSTATYLMLVAALLSASALQGAVIVGTFGLVRGLTLLAASGVRAPDTLVSFHRRLELLEPGAARAGLALLGAALVLGSVA